MDAKTKKILTKLGKEKVELNLQNVINKLIIEAKEAIGLGSRISNNIASRNSQISGSVINDIEALNSEIKSGFREADNYLGYIVQESEQQLNKANRIAKELGVSPKDIDNFDKLLTLGREAKKEKDFLNTAKREGERIIQLVKKATT